MRAVLYTQFPLSVDKPRGGVSAAGLSLIRKLRENKDVDLHVICFEDQIEKDQIKKFGNATIHRLKASRMPQMIDIFWRPGRQRLKRYILDLKPDIVHFAETYGLSIYNLPVPIVFTVHGFDHANIVTENQRMATLRSFLWRFFEKRGFSRHRYIISINPYVRSMIEPHTKAKLFNINNAIDPTYFNIKHVPIKGRLFFAGWISPRKNPLTIIRAISVLIKQGIDVHARFAGEHSDSEYSLQINNEIKDLHLEEHISLLGRIPAIQIREELSQSQIFILPSLQENAPMAISEALAVGVPVISSNRCGMPYMIKDGETGFIIEPNDAEMLAKRIAHLVNNSEIYKKMSSAAKQSATDLYHPDVIAKKTYELYKNILEGKC
jgi:glycosyltransferase involved in cell wall biosynthesis